MWRRRESVKSIVYNKRLAPFWMDGGSFMLCPLVQFMSFHYKWQSSNAKEFRSPDLRATWRFGPLSNSASTLLSADTISAPINFHFMVSDADDCADHTQILLHSLSLSLSLSLQLEKSPNETNVGYAESHALSLSLPIPCLQSYGGQTEMKKQTRRHKIWTGQKEKIISVLGSPLTPSSFLTSPLSLSFHPPNAKCRHNLAAVRMRLHD